MKATGKTRAQNNVTPSHFRELQGNYKSSTTTNGTEDKTYTRLALITSLRVVPIKSEEQLAANQAHNHSDRFINANSPDRQPKLNFH